MKADQETLYWTVRVDTLMCQFCCRIPRSGCHRDKTRSAVVGITNWQILKLRLFFLLFIICAKKKTDTQEFSSTTA